MQTLLKLCQPDPGPELPISIVLPWVWGRRPLLCPLVAYVDMTFSPSPQRDCQNYIKILLPLNSSHLLSCGTAAFSPLCAYVVSSPFYPGAWLPGAQPSCQGSSSLALIPGEGGLSGQASR